MYSISNCCVYILKRERGRTQVAFIKPLHACGLQLQLYLFCGVVVQEMRRISSSFLLGGSLLGSGSTTRILELISEPEIPKLDWIIIPGAYQLSSKIMTDTA